MGDPCYMEFQVADEERYANLVSVIDALKAEKQSGSLRPDPKWLAYFNDKARAHFWWPSPAEAEEHSRRWFATPLPERWTDESLKTPWDFDSLIDAFGNGEYDLLGIRRMGQVARLEFEPQAFPYGGTGCMQAIIEAFDFEVVLISDGSQPPYTP